MEELIRPNVTGEWYKPSDAVRILNHAQANFYLSRGVPLLDIYVSRGKTVYVFLRSASYESYKLWNQRNKTESEESTDNADDE